MADYSKGSITLTGPDGPKTYESIKAECNKSGSTELPIASATTLGGVKVGNGLKIDTQGTLSVDVATNTEIDALFN